MKTVFSALLKIVAGVALACSATVAIAGDVSWSVTVGSPHAGGYVYAPPPPAVVYVQPRPHYVRPRPVYVQPAPVVTYGQPYYYVEAPRPRHHWKRDRHHGHGHDYGHGYHRHGRHDHHYRY